MVIISPQLLGFPPQVGSGKHGDIEIYGDVDIRTLYNEDKCTGVKTYRGSNKGLAAGSYNPKEGRVIEAVNFIIHPGARLRNPAQYSYYQPPSHQIMPIGHQPPPTGMVTHPSRGVVFIRAHKFTCLGVIDQSGMGWHRGSRRDSGIPSSGIGPGGGSSGGSGDRSGGSGGGSYNYVTTGGLNGFDSDYGKMFGSGGGSGGSGSQKIMSGTIPTQWRHWSGGGGGGAGHRGGGAGGSNRNTQQISSKNGTTTGRRGGYGGGAVMIFAMDIEIAPTAWISADGLDGENASGSNWHASGGGGSGGLIYLESVRSASLSEGRISSRGGSKGGRNNSTRQVRGGDAATGRIIVKGPYTGSTSIPAIDPLV